MLARNSLFSIAGSVVPVLITVVTLPFLLSTIGAERYGALALCWLILIYAAQVLSGIGTAITHNVARAEDDKAVERDTMASGIATALVVSPLIGVLASIVALVFFGQYFQVSETVGSELSASIWLIGLGSFVSGLSRVCNGALVGKERFATASIAAMVSNGGLPLLALAFSQVFGPSMVVLLWASLLAYSLGLLILLADLWQSQLRMGPLTVSWNQSKSLLQFGFWIMATAVIAPLLLTLDRMVIGAQLGAVAVAAYTIPFQIISRLQLVPQSVINVLFPRLSVNVGDKARRMAFLYSIAMTAFFAPIIVGLIYLIEPLLQLWLGENLDPQSVKVGLWLLLAFYVTAIEHTMVVFLQSQGHGSSVAKFKFAEIIPYVAVLLYCADAYGLMGVAGAFLVRRILEALLFVAKSGFGSFTFWKTQIPTTIGLIIAMLTVGQLDGFIAKLAIGAIVATLTLAGAVLAAPAELKAMIAEQTRNRLPLGRHG